MTRYWFFSFEILKVIHLFFSHVLIFIYFHSFPTEFIHYFVFVHSLASFHIFQRHSPSFLIHYSSSTHHTPPNIHFVVRYKLKYVYIYKIYTLTICLDSIIFILCWQLSNPKSTFNVACTSSHITFSKIYNVSI